VNTPVDTKAALADASAAALFPMKCWGNPFHKGWDSATLVAHIRALAAEVERLRVLAERAYPGLKESGICSAHCRDCPASCERCYPDPNALLAEHQRVEDQFYEAVLSAAGVSDPPGGRFGWKPALDILSGIRLVLDAERANVAELEAALCAVWNDVAGDVGGEPHLIQPGPLYRVRKALHISDGGPFAALEETK
jgi:hypothetical protein